MSWGCERLELSFGAGFTVLTGETGAGKSILLDALDALLGGAEGSRGAPAGLACGQQRRRLDRFAGEEQLLEDEGENV